MRLPNIDTEHWTLVSGVERHQASPDTFWIPADEQRQRLRPGDAAKLIFEIQSKNEDGQISADYERMWVVVSEVTPPYFIGRLDNIPLSRRDDSTFYLARDVEVPFLPEHVIDIDRPPKTYLDALFSAPPAKTWPR